MTVMTSAVSMKNIEPEKSGIDPSKIVIGAGIEVHREMGSFHDVNVYVNALAHELRIKDVSFRSNEKVPFKYKGKIIEGQEMHFIVENELAIIISDNEAGFDEVRWMRDAMSCLNIKTGLIMCFRGKTLSQYVKRVEVD